jgi:hypothetical protein
VGVRVDMHPAFARRCTALYCAVLRCIEAHCMAGMAWDEGVIG